MRRVFNYIFWVSASACMLFAGWLLVRIFCCDQFVVPSESMMPALLPGDRILVNKLLAGSRIYSKLEFRQDVPLRSFRMPGLRGVRVNDVVVFNAPHGYDRDRIEFRINYVYAKRCVGMPGDSIAIRNGYFCNNRYKGVIGDAVQQGRLAAIPDSLLPPNVLRALPFDDRRYGWTIKNMGPLYIPRAGDRVELDSLNDELYRLVVEYETGGSLTCEGHLLRLYGEAISTYEFRENYYFFCGDNVINSKDCRYLGFVPEEFIIGVACRITYSEDPLTGVRRPGRWWKAVE